MNGLKRLVIALDPLNKFVRYLDKIVRIALKLSKLAEKISNYNWFDSRQVNKLRSVQSITKFIFNAALKTSFFAAFVGKYNSLEKVLDLLPRIFSS